MPGPLHTVAETEGFIADCKAAGVSEAERAAIIGAVAADPVAGSLIVGSAGARKVRVAGRGHGKSGGWRVITAYLGSFAPVYLLALYGKGAKANLRADEIAALAAFVRATKVFWKGRQ